MFKKIIRSRFNCTVILIITLLYLTFSIIDIFINPRSLQASYLKFASIVLCFALATNLYRKSGDKHDSKYVIVALFFTMIADIFLLFNLSHFAGVFIFCIVQLIYIKRYNCHAFKFALVTIMLLPFIILFRPLNPLHILAGCYAILILTTFYTTFKVKLPHFNLKCIRLGMLLFILCDVHVALYNLLSRSNPYHQIATVLMWTFYLPAQVLLAMSTYHARKSR